MNPNDQQDYFRLMVAVFLAAILLTSWQAFYDAPRREKLAAYHTEKAKIEAARKDEYAKKAKIETIDAYDNPNLTRDERLALSPRIRISSNTLHGSIALRGAKFDDLTLAQYKKTLKPDAEEVVLFSPSGSEQTYLAQIGWVAADGDTRVPDSQSLWSASHNRLEPATPVTLSWNNGEGVTFQLIVELDQYYMFNVTQHVINESGQNITLIPYGYINRAHNKPESQQALILHEGPLGIVENSLKEISYDELETDGSQSFKNSNGWFGITDKYWLSAIAPSKTQFKTTYSHYQKSGLDRFQVDYLGDRFRIENGGKNTTETRLFAGAKVVDILDYYTEGEGGDTPIPLFDRAVDFGALYFMTKPIFLLLDFFYKLVGNFGIAILLLTMVIKLALFPLANAGYKSAAQMRRLQPEMLRLKERYADDRMAFQKELMAMYKKEKVNPASGCLPILIQMPVFFALYKVLYVTIEMRHAPFFGWLKDLSAQDPSNIFTLFGIIDWTPPSLLHLGILPIVMCATMVIQMSQQPTPSDPVQAKVMKFMPYAFLFIFASFPAGLVLYWIFSNIFSILQQAVMIKKHGSAKTLK